MPIDSILKDYDDKYNLYISFSEEIERIIMKLLATKKISVHSVNHRVKEKLSLKNKIESRRKYSTLSEITDIIGIRIISHYLDEVDKIAEVIESEFIVDRENSINKKIELSSDRFGYLSLHYVVSFKESRLDLIENSKFSGLKAEIQIRTILQHTWAEIEHDLGYKSDIGLPYEFRRKFSRLAGLLEIADNEFLNIKNSLLEYGKNMDGRISISPETVDVNIISLKGYINENASVNSVDAILSSEFGFNLYPILPQDLEFILKIIKVSGVVTIYELNDIVLNNMSLIYPLMEKLTTSHTCPEQYQKSPNGVSIYYIFNLYLVRINKINDLRELLISYNFESKNNFNNYIDLLSSVINEHAIAN